ATTMIIVSGKAFIIVPLVPGAKSTLAKEDDRAPLNPMDQSRESVSEESARLSFYQ
ncbi:hypothetical protein Tco_0850929, partial [Tanacetum coccineum]